MSRFIWIMAAFVLLMILTGCAGPNTAQTSSGVGFIEGLIQGFIAPVTFIISIFDSNVNVYEVQNNGLPYNLGFVLGAGILFGGSSKAT